MAVFTNAVPYWQIFCDPVDRVASDTASFEVTKDVARTRHYQRRSKSRRFDEAQPIGIYDAPSVPGWNDGLTRREETRLPRCAECGCLSALRWARWRTYGADVSEPLEPPTLAFYCRACAEADDTVKACAKDGESFVGIPRLLNAGPGCTA
jgi:hypothetical protein